MEFGLVFVMVCPQCKDSYHEDKDESNRAFSST